MPPEPKQFQCASCSRRFGRAEHLRRHESIHSLHTRPFRCETCSKTFLRRDALQRHESTHNAQPSLLQRGGRACSSCAAAKVRCSGGSRCARCVDKGIPCAYPNSDTDQQLQLCSPPKPADQQSFAPNVVYPNLPLEQNRQLPEHAYMDVNMWDPSVLLSTNWLTSMPDMDYSNFPPLEMPFGNPNPFGGQAADPILPPASPMMNDMTDTPSQSDSPCSRFSGKSAGVVVAASTDAVSSGKRPTEPGEYYVDGETARLPRVKRHKSLATRRIAEPEFESITSFSLQILATSESQSTRSFEIQPAAYQEIIQSYQTLCRQPLGGMWPAFESPQIPDARTFARLLELYFEHFDQCLPCFHHTTLEEVSQHGLLILALSTVGSHFLGQYASTIFTVSLHEFLRRWLLSLRESAFEERSAGDLHARAELMYLIGAAYCGDGRLRKHAHEYRQTLARIFNGRRALVDVSNESGLGYSNQSEDAEWLSWSRQESRIRLCYSIWLVDCMLAYHSPSPPNLNGRACTISLPCPDRLWTAGNAQEWKSMYSTSYRQPDLNQTLQALYVDKKLSRDLGEFARVLVIHGLFHRQWEVERYLSNPLSQWQPTASRESSSELLPNTPIWLPSIPEFTHWQNSACDCLDLLHWQANATIGQAKGMEHPTVLHLHLARVVLLAPYAEIIELVQFMTSRSYDSGSVVQKQQAIQGWALQHQYKARLAMIHAGVVLWHVRRFSNDAFYEAPAVALAALSLWAFATFANKQVDGTSASRTPKAAVRDLATGVEGDDDDDDTSEPSDDSNCDIILLDRPTDDELVQRFIRSGDKMKVQIGGVGNLYGPKGPARILAQGCKLLSTLRCWGISSYWLHMLKDLADVIGGNEPRRR